MRFFALTYFIAALFMLPVLQARDDDVPSVLLLSRLNTEQSRTRTVYRVGVDSSVQDLVSIDIGPNLSVLDDYWVLLGDGTQGVNLADSHPAIQPVTFEEQSAPDYLADIRKATGQDLNPLFGPQAIDLPYPEYAWADFRLYIMSGADDTAVNLYAISDGELRQLTDVEALFPKTRKPLLSASVEFVARRPVVAGFLYRARVRDANGADYNRLYLYDMEQEASEEMPFFGKDPVWSPDGMALAGSRLGEADDGRPRYSLWIVDLETGDEQELVNACNPQWSSDGTWLAYDLHETAMWQGYIDCFASGQVEGVNLETGERVMLSEGLPDFVTLIGWLDS